MSIELFFPLRKTCVAINHRIIRICYKSYSYLEKKPSTNFKKVFIEAHDVFDKIHKSITFLIQEELSCFKLNLLTSYRTSL